MLWLIALLLQTASLACTLYQLVQLADLEMDVLNPHDACRNYNSVLLPLLAAEVAFAVVLLAGGKWVLGALAVGVVVYDVASSNAKIASVDVYRVLKKNKARVTKKTAAAVLLFVWSLWRFVESIVISLISHHGKEQAAAVLREAAATLYH